MTARRSEVAVAVPAAVPALESESARESESAEGPYLELESEPASGPDPASESGSATVGAAPFLAGW
jgi:hypothetical protein